MPRFWRAEARPQDSEDAPVVLLAGREVPVRLIAHPRARSVKLRYDALAGAVTVTMPRDHGARQALSFVARHRGWLERRMHEAVTPIRLEHGGELALEGHARIIVWHREAPRRPSLSEGEIHVGGEQASLEARLLRWLRVEARARFVRDLTDYCALAGEAEPVLSIGDARTRWGSYSRRGGVRLNWRLVMAPATVRRSVVAHEVAHIRHFDHGKQFYAHLDALFEGNRKAADDWLRCHGPGLRAVGAVPG